MKSIQHEMENNETEKQKKNKKERATPSGKAEKGKQLARCVLTQIGFRPKSQISPEAD